MTASFNQILIPVDFTINTKVAIKKALALCHGSDAAIHLLHVARIVPTNIISIYQYFANYSFSSHEVDLRVAEEKMEEVRNYVLNIRQDISISTWVSFGISIEATIIEKARKLNADVIIIGKNSHHSWMPFLNTVVSSRIAKESGVTVLTVKPGAINNAIRTVVVPISDQFPVSKVAVINTLRKKFRIHIRLVTFLTGQDNSRVIPAALLNAYRVLKNNPSGSVSYEILYGHNKARSILKYCNKVNADMLIVNPGSETWIGWPNKQMSDMLPTHSKTQILAVHNA
jgi:nucleotide-binding universal stress UspA family protein